MFEAFVIEMTDGQAGVEKMQPAGSGRFHNAGSRTEVEFRPGLIA